ncbi:MAG: hypothetical protein ACF8AM_24045 [Rhodopirellula sp. JB055]|uniref:hypothetical protein n=1 Tax=Rhodopirellula sp. JB055 TaxID=3342846 RepID=UPI00370CA4AF
MTVATAVAIFKLMALSFNPHDFAFTASLPKRTSVCERVGLMIACWLVAWSQLLPPAFPPVSIAKEVAASSVVSTLQNVVAAERAIAMDSDRGAASVAQTLKDARERSISLDLATANRCDQTSRVQFAWARQAGAWASIGAVNSLVNLHVRLQI